jgi:hypothetical protein
MVYPSNRRLHFSQYVLIDEKGETGFPMLEKEVPFTSFLCIFNPTNLHPTSVDMKKSLVYEEFLPCACKIKTSKKQVCFFFRHEKTPTFFVECLVSLQVLFTFFLNIFKSS